MSRCKGKLRLPEILGEQGVSMQGSLQLSQVVQEGRVRLAGRLQWMLTSVLRALSHTPNCRCSLSWRLDRQQVCEGQGFAPKLGKAARHLRFVSA